MSERNSNSTRPFGLGPEWDQTLPRIIEDLRQLAHSGPSVDNLGICYNLHQISEHDYDGYVLLEEILQGLEDVPEWWNRYGDGAWEDGEREAWCLWAADVLEGGAA